ncbi:MAG: hypothetical protein HQM04_12035 [Magnetococcales bacterium]|nr:hypothetical protein [Magnetococcales bacterium]MBF0115753.1 hypothetical protein [Magnetococcales bacterium]
MKIFLFWYVRVINTLLVLGLFSVPQWGVAGEEGAGLRRAVAEVNSGRDLLTQQIHVDRPDVKMDGELVLRSLKPLTGELRLQRAQGEPKQIFAVVLRLLPGVKSGFDHLFDLVDVHDLTLQDLVIGVTGEGYALQLAKAEIPEGSLQQVSGWMDLQKSWQVESGALNVRHLPLRGVPQGMAVLPVSFKRLQASGDRQDHYGVEVERFKIGHLSFVSDPQGVWGEILRQMGFARGLSSSPIVFDRVASQWDVDGRQIATRMLQVQAPGGQASGKAVMPWQPEPRQVQVTLDVTSSARRGESKRFQTVVPVGKSAYDR